MLENKVQVSAIQYGNVKSKQGKAVDALAIAKLWMISPSRANNPVRRTTQHDIRTVMKPLISRRYPTNYRMLRYPRLLHSLLTDTIIAGTVSNCGNNNAQLYVTYFGWTRLFPMKLKSDAHETLPLLFKRYGIPPEMIMDNSKEQLSSDFCKKLRESNFHQKTIKLHPPWITAGDINIHELKCSCSQKMIKTQSQKFLWDHCAELEARICSCTAHDYYLLDGEVPETVMKGHTVDISTI